MVVSSSGTPRSCSAASTGLTPSTSPTLAAWIHTVPAAEGPSGVSRSSSPPRVRRRSSSTSTPSGTSNQSSALYKTMGATRRTPWRQSR
jgi:hypothetical protein